MSGDVGGGGRSSRSFVNAASISASVAEAMQCLTYVITFLLSREDVVMAYTSLRQVGQVERKRRSDGEMQSR